MKILITQRELINFGGSELYTVDVARRLAARGHAVAVFCPRPGDLAQLLTPSGIFVKSRLNELPWAPDLVHGQHHLPAMAALAHFPDARAIYVWHGVTPWVEQLPTHPRIARYVATSDCMAPQIQVELGVPSELIVTIRNFVDMRRFSEVRTPRPTPHRALLFHQRGFSDWELDCLEQACTANGLSLDKIGAAYNNPQPRPEVFLPQYDIVFAVGRSALEALACGCAVIPVVPGLAGQRVTAENLEHWASWNYSPRFFTSAAQVSPAWLRREIEGTTVASIAETTAMIRGKHDLELAIDRFEDLYRDVLEGPAPRGATDEFAPYLERLARDVDELWFKWLVEQHKVESLEAAMAADTTAKSARRPVMARLGAIGTRLVRGKDRVTSSHANVESRGGT